MIGATGGRTVPAQRRPVGLPGFTRGTRARRSRRPGADSVDPSPALVVRRSEQARSAAGGPAPSDAGLLPTSDERPHRPGGGPHAASPSDVSPCWPAASPAPERLDPGAPHSRVRRQACRLLVNFHESVAGAGPLSRRPVRAGGRSDERHPLAKKSKIAAFTASGRSRNPRCPVSAISRYRPLGMALATSAPRCGGNTRSSANPITSTDAVIA